MSRFFSFISDLADVVDLEDLHEDVAKTLGGALDLVAEKVTDVAGDVAELADVACDGVVGNLWEIVKERYVTDTLMEALELIKNIIGEHCNLTGSTHEFISTMFKGVLGKLSRSDVSRTRSWRVWSSLRISLVSIVT